MGRRAWAVTLWAAWLAACAPALDWREVRPQQSGVLALFPCKPSSHARRLHLAGTEVEMFVLACKASGTTFSLGYADVHDAARVEPALAALRDAAVANISGRLQRNGAPQAPGMTANAAAGRLQLVGTLPNGAAARMDAAFFVKGTRVFQASVVAEGRLEAEPVEVFLSGIKLSAWRSAQTFLG